VLHPGLAMLLGQDLPGASQVAIADPGADPVAPLEDAKYLMLGDAP
jgi:hypothetical protein